MKPHPILSTSFLSGYRNNPPLFFTLKSNFSFKSHGILSLSPVITSCSLSLPSAIFSLKPRSVIKFAPRLTRLLCSSVLAHQATATLNPELAALPDDLIQQGPKLVFRTTRREGAKTVFRWATRAASRDRIKGEKSQEIESISASAASRGCSCKETRSDWCSRRQGVSGGGSNAFSSASPKPYLRPDKEPLNWNTRMMIAAGAAKGLEYLHHDAEPPVIYRDVKSANILLGEDFYPKLSDFGLAKFGPTGDRSHVSTRVMGTHGYCAPEYAKSGRLTAKSDIYSFGIVLLELLTGHKAVDSTLGREKQLVEWARPFMRNPKNLTMQFADPYLRGQFPLHILRKALAVASMCLQEDASLRPTMRDVVLALNFLTTHPYNEPKVLSISTKRVDEIKSSNASGNNSPNETTSMLNKNDERERAVAEAKMWGETWRDKRRPGAQNSHHDTFSL